MIRGTSVSGETKSTLHYMSGGLEKGVGRIAIPTIGCLMSFVGIEAKAQATLHSLSSYKLPGYQIGIPLTSEFLLALDRYQKPDSRP